MPGPALRGRCSSPPAPARGGGGQRAHRRCTGGGGRGRVCTGRRGESSGPSSPLPAWERRPRPAPPRRLRSRRQPAGATARVSTLWTKRRCRPRGPGLWLPAPMQAGIVCRASGGTSCADRCSWYFYSPARFFSFESPGGRGLEAGDFSHRVLSDIWRRAPCDCLQTLLFTVSSLRRNRG